MVIVIGEGRVLLAALGVRWAACEKHPLPTLTGACGSGTRPRSHHEKDVLPSCQGSLSIHRISSGLLGLLLMVATWRI